MKSATTHPTPQKVVDAVQVIAAWLREIDAAEALVSPEGGAAFHGERLTAKYLNEWGIAERRLELATRIIAHAKKWAAHDDVLRDLLREWEVS